MFSRDIVLTFDLQLTLKFTFGAKQALGDHGIICLEDLVHEIATIGPHFQDASKFLMPVKLKCPERRLQMKKKPYKDGGDSGDRGDKINELIEKLN